MSLLRSRKVISIITLTFLIVSSFQQLILPTMAYGAMDISPVGQDVRNVPLGTDEGGHSPSFSETLNNSTIISTPDSQPSPETSAGSFTQEPTIQRELPIQEGTNKFVNRLKTDGIHRRFVLPDGVKGEYVEARSQYSKVFVKENGNFAAIIKNDSLHYRDLQGKWQDIDTRLKPSNQAGFAYESTANRFQSFFAEKGQNKLLRFQYGDKWFELNPQDRKETKPQINGDTITYPDIYDGIDLQYIVGSDSLIENTILNKNTGKNSFVYDFKAKNLTHRLEADGSISFLDKTTGTLAFKLAKPYMYDANGEQSTNVTLKLDESVTNKAVLIVEADPSWLDSPNRAFPVVIDPDVILQQEVKNTFVRRDSNEKYSGTNFNSDLDLEVGYYKDINMCITLPAELS